MHAAVFDVFWCGMILTAMKFVAAKAANAHQILHTVCFGNHLALRAVNRHSTVWSS